MVGHLEADVPISRSVWMMEKKEKIWKRRDDNTTNRTGYDTSLRCNELSSNECCNHDALCKAWSLLQGVGLQVSLDVDVQGEINAIGTGAMQDVKSSDHSTNHT